jgi:hypothetical protein
MGSLKPVMKPRSLKDRSADFTEIRHLAEGEDS